MRVCSIGDSGGPLFQYDENDEPVLVGVVSRGVGCADADFPGIYVRTATYADFLDLDQVKRTESTDEVMFNDQELAPTGPPNSEESKPTGDINDNVETPAKKDTGMPVGLAVGIAVSVAAALLLVVGLPCAFLAMRGTRDNKLQPEVRAGARSFVRGDGRPVVVATDAGGGVAQEADVGAEYEAASGSGGCRRDGVSSPSSLGSVDISFAGRIAEPRRLHRDDESISITSSMAETGESDTYEPPSSLSVWFHAGEETNL